MEPTNLNRVRSILANRGAQLAREYGVAWIGVFGSTVREEASEDSDIDLLVEFDRPIGLLKFIDLEDRLSDWLQAPVDLVTKNALKPHIGKRILDEVAPI